MVARRKTKGQQSETEREFGEVLQMADPMVANFVARHETLRERVAVLERALEQIAEHDQLGRSLAVRVLAARAQAALDA